MALHGYENNKRWRKKHPQKHREERSRYKEHGRRFASATRRLWSEQEDTAILEEVRPSDRALAQQLRRSIDAIQIRRVRLRHRQHQVEKRAQE